MTNLDPRLQHALERRAARLGATARDPNPIKAKRDAAELLTKDDPDWAYRYLSERTKYGYISTCALEVREYFTDLGATDPEIVGPYAKRPGMAMIDVAEVAKRHGAWAKDLTQMPKVGDVMRIDNATRTNAHVIVVVGVDAPTGVIFGIAGGRVDNTVTSTQDTLLVCPEHKGFRPYLVDPMLPYKLDGEPNGREVTGRVDIDAFLASLAA